MSFIVSKGCHKPHLYTPCVEIYRSGNDVSDCLYSQQRYEDIPKTQNKQSIKYCVKQCRTASQILTDY